MFYLNVLISGIAQGLMWVLLTLGVFLNFRVIKFSDMTSEGTLPLGAAITVVLINNGVNPVISLFISAIFGACAGIITGTLATYLKIQPILAGILTMTALYSINLRVLSEKATIVISGISLKNSFSFIENSRYKAILIGLIIAIIAIIALFWLFSTRIGFAIRATGSNPKMAMASAINTSRTIIIALALSNALVAVSGGVIAQFEYGSAIVTMGQGSIVIGLASVIIGEKILLKKNTSILFKLIAVSLGAIIYRCLVAFALLVPALKATDLKLITAILVAITLCVPAFKKRKFKFTKV